VQASGLFAGGFTMDNLYIFEEGQWQLLQSIKKRLYAPAALSPDERRDLANQMDAVLQCGVTIIPQDRVTIS
jgi:hypothetical protein